MGSLLTFNHLQIPGLVEVSPTRLEDERGAFFRTYCQDEFDQAGLKVHWLQTNHSINRYKGTFRGLHFQDKPFEEDKLVRCVKGAVFDVVLDLRPESETYLTHVTVTLSAPKANQLFIPAGCAHGFLTLEDDSELTYFHSAAYDPQRDSGVNVLDPTFNIQLPNEIKFISEKDKQFKFLPR